MSRREPLGLAAILAACAWLAATAPAMALSFENSPLQPAPLRTPPGVTSWDLLGQAAVVFGEADGEETVTTIIPPEVERLDGTPVSLMGYMFPLEAEPELKRFLLVEYPADCPFCLAGMVEPSRMVEVEAGATIPWNDEPVILAGRLEILRDDADGLVYRLHDARLAP
jgi:hypothetical protein